jgi:hypothetical protein
MTDCSTITKIVHALTVSLFVTCLMTRRALRTSLTGACHENATNHFHVQLLPIPRIRSVC